MTSTPFILALTTDAYGGRGGIAQYNRDLLAAFAASSASPRVTVLPRNSPDAVSTPQNVVQLPAHRGRFAYSLAALKLALAGHFCLVYCGHLYMAPLAWVIARLIGARLVIQAYGIEVWNRPSRLVRKAVEAADLVLCISRHTRSSVLSWASIAPERAVILAPTVSPEFTPGPQPRTRFDWAGDGQKILLCVGRMAACEAYKGHDRVIAAIPRVVELGQDVVFVALGDGDDLPRLARLAQEHGVAERVRFQKARGFEELVAAYRAADLFIMPSTGEGFGIVFLEAMACGTPAIGLAVGGARDALADGELGWITTPETLADDISKCLRRDQPSAEALAADVQRRFGWSAFQNVVDAIVSRLLSNVSSSGSLARCSR